MLGGGRGGWISHWGKKRGTQGLNLSVEKIREGWGGDLLFIRKKIRTGQTVIVCTWRGGVGPNLYQRSRTNNPVLCLGTIRIVYGA